MSEIEGGRAHTHSISRSTDRLGRNMLTSTTGISLSPSNCNVHQTPIVLAIMTNPDSQPHWYLVFGLSAVVIAGLAAAVAVCSRQPGMKKLWGSLSDMATEYNNQYIDDDDDASDANGEKND